MKKIFSLTLMALLACRIVQAETYEQIQIVPAVIKTGTTATLNVRFDNPGAKDKVMYLQFTIAYPEGWTVQSGLTFNKKRACEYDPDFEEYGDEMLSYAVTALDGNQRKYIIYAKDNKSAVIGDSGTIFSVKVKAPAGTPDGYYPINILAENSYYCTDTDAAHNVNLGASTSFVKVGNPSGHSLAMQGTIPSFVNDSLAREKGIASLDLSQVTTSNGVFTYRPGRDVKAPETEVISQCKFMADSPEENHRYASVTAPFDATFNCYVLGEKNGQGLIELIPSTTLKEGESAIINKAVESQVVSDKLRTIEKTQVESGAYLKDDTFYHVNGNAVIPALRGYWNLGTDVKGFMLTDDEDGLQDIKLETEETVYNVAGQRLVSKQHGVNIVNDKKVANK